MSSSHFIKSQRQHKEQKQHLFLASALQVEGVKQSTIIKKSKINRYGQMVYQPTVIPQKQSIVVEEEPAVEPRTIMESARIHGTEIQTQITQEDENISSTDGEIDQFVATNRINMVSDREIQMFNTDNLNSIESNENAKRPIEHRHPVMEVPSTSRLLIKQRSDNINSEIRASTYRPSNILALDNFIKSDPMRQSDLNTPDPAR